MLVIFMFLVWSVDGGAPADGGQSLNSVYWQNRSFVFDRFQRVGECLLAR